MKRAIRLLASFGLVLTALLFVTIATSQDAYARDSRVEDLSGTDGEPQHKVHKDGKWFYYNYLQDHLDHSRIGREVKKDSGKNYWQVKWYSNGARYVRLSIINKAPNDVIPNRVKGAGLIVQLEKWNETDKRWSRVGEGKCIGLKKCNFEFEDKKPEVGTIYAINFLWAKNGIIDLPVKFDYYLKQNVYESPASKGYKLVVKKGNNPQMVIVSTRTNKEQKYNGWYRCEWKKSNKSGSCGHGNVDNKKNKMILNNLEDKGKVVIDVKYVGEIGEYKGQRLYYYGEYKASNDGNGGGNNGGGSNGGNDEGDQRRERPAPPKTENVDIKLSHQFDKTGKLFVNAEIKGKNIKGEWVASAGNDELKKTGKEVSFTFNKANIKATNGVIPLKVTFNGKDGNTIYKGSLKKNLVKIKINVPEKQPKEKLTIQASLVDVKKATGSFTFTFNNQQKEVEVEDKNVVNVTFDNPKKENQLKITFSGKVGDKKVTGTNKGKVTYNGSGDHGDGGNDNQDDNDQNDNDKGGNGNQGNNDKGGNGNQGGSDKGGKDDQDDGNKDDGDQGDNGDQGDIDDPGDNGQPNDDEEPPRQDQTRNHLSNNQVGGKLPRTATPYAIILLVGLSLLTIGAIILRMRRASN